MQRTKQQLQKLSAHVQFQTVSPATKLLQQRRKMYEVHQAFEVQKEQFKKHQQNFKSKEQDIRKRDLQIQIHLINFCQYLQENDSKRKKAEERFKQDMEVYNKKQQEIKRLQQQISIAEEKQEKFDRKVASLRKYEQYLQKVRATYSDQYPEMSDILSRYQTLKKFNQNLLRDRDQMQSQKEALKKQSAVFQKQMNQQILQLSNFIKQQSKTLQLKTNEKQQLQSDLQRNKDLYERKNLDLAKMLMAIDNLYSKCSEGIVKITYRYQQFVEQEQPKNKRGNKRNDDKAKSKKEEQRKDEDDQSPIQIKSKIAIQKLKSIMEYTKDYQKIIKETKEKITSNSNIKK